MTNIILNEKSLQVFCKDFLYNFEHFTLIKQAQRINQIR